MSEVVPFGETNFRNQTTRFGIKTDDRRRHMYVIGKTGMGKTNMIQNMVIEDIRSGKGIAVVDPHGEFAETILQYIPEERIEDIIYFNPADLHHPISFNVMENVAPEYRHLITDGLIAIFQKLWATSWGPRLEYVLRNTILALLEVPNSTLLGIMRMLVDKSYRKWVVGQLKDPVIRAFWVEEFAKYPDRFATEAVAPIQNKVGQFLANPLIRNIVGQGKTAFDIRKGMDDGKVFIINLSKGRIGEGTSRLLGAMMITKFQLAAMSRIDTPEDERPDFYLYVDEFQNFATEAFVGILSEARKYRLSLILAHQYIAQLEEGASTVVRDAVFGNVGTMVSFRVGAADAEFLEKEFEPEFMVTDLVNLAKYHIYLKLMIDGVSSRAFSATTLAPILKPERSYAEEIIDFSRKAYGVPREEVEQTIKEWAGPIESAESSEASGIGGEKRQKDRPMFTTQCAVCGKDTEVPFEPDGKRPVYCSEHHKAVQSGEIPAVVPARPQKRERNAGTRPDARPARSERPRVDRSDTPGTKPVDAGLVVKKATGDRLSLSDLPSRENVVAREEMQRTPKRHARPKKPTDRQERAKPDLSGLRDILREAVSENDLEKRVEEESVNDILGK